MSKEGDLMKPKIIYLAVYSQFNNLKLADNKLFIQQVPDEEDLAKNWFVFKNQLNQDCMNYPDCEYCPYHTTFLHICLSSVLLSWKFDQ